MRLIINLVLVLIIVGLIYLLAESIREPIAFKAEKDRREQAVIDKLREIREAQEVYRSVSGGPFAPTWDTLTQVLREGQIPFISVIGDPDDPNFTGVITYDTTFQAAIETVNEKGWSLDSLKYIPFSNGKAFDIKADTLSYQKTKVHVVEIGTSRANFMGAYADPRFKRYDNRYNPNSIIKFGDMNKPTLSGNWEN